MFLIKTDCFNKTEKLLKEAMNGKVLVTGWDMNPLRPAIIDSGCSSDTHPQELATQKFPNKVRSYALTEQQSSMDHGMFPWMCVCHRDLHH